MQFNEPKSITATVSFYFEATRPDFKATLSFRDGLQMVREWYDADPRRKESTPWALKVEAALDRALAAWRNG